MGDRRSSVRADTVSQPPRTSCSRIGQALRQKAQERRIASNLKPFRWNPAGNQSRPVELGQQPEASLAWWAGDHPCEA